MIPYKVKIADYKDRPQDVYHVLQYKDGCIYKTKKIGTAIKSEYEKLPKNVNCEIAFYGIPNELELEGKIIQTLTCDEIIKICGTH